MTVLELKRWIRSKKMFVLFLFFISISLTSALSSYYASDIIKVMVPENQAQIVLGTTSWEQITYSFFKTSAQLGLFVSLYLILKIGMISSSESLKIFYMTRTENFFRIYTPKLLSSLLVFISTWLSGFLVAIYVIFVLYDTFNMEKLIVTAMYHLIMLLLLVTICFTLNSIVGSPFIISALVEVLLMILSSFSRMKVVQRYSGIHLLFPKSLLSWKDAFELENIEPIGYACLYLLAIGFLVWLLKRFRRRVWSLR